MMMTVDKGIQNSESRIENSEPEATARNHRSARRRTLLSMTSVSSTTSAEIFATR